MSLHTLNNLSNVGAGLTPGLGKIGAVAGQAACRNVVAQGKDRGYRIASRKWNEFILQTDKKAISTNEHCVDLPFPQSCENALYLANAAGSERDKLQAKHGRRCLEVAQLRCCIGIIGIHEHADYGSVGGKLMQYFQILWSQTGKHERDARDVARGAVEARYQVCCDRIAARHENNGYRLRNGLCRSRCHQVGGSDDSYAVLDQVGGQ